MTTIAYRDGIVATDSQATQGEVAVDLNVEKRWIVDGVQFFCCGNLAEVDELINAYFTGHARKDELNVSALVWDKDMGKLQEIGVMPGTGLWTYSVKKDQHLAFGSGGSFALGAMDMGASAKQAVQIATQRDIFSGGKIKTYRLWK